MTWCRGRKWLPVNSTRRCGAWPKGRISRRNLAGQLASRLFLPQERVESNCRGACEKSPYSQKCKQYTPVALPTTPLSIWRQAPQPRKRWEMPLMKFGGRQRLHKACIASVDIINFIPYLLLSYFCIELFIFHVQICSIPTMIIRTIVAMFFSIL